jgi:hypothetical protein
VAVLPIDVNEQALASPDPAALAFGDDLEEVPELIAAAPFSGGGRIMARRRNDIGGGSPGAGGPQGGGDANDSEGAGGPNGGPDAPGAVAGPGRPGGPGSEDPPYVAPLDPNAPVSVPEPGSLLLVGTGLAAYALRRRRSKTAPKAGA